MHVFPFFAMERKQGDTKDAQVLAFIKKKLRMNRKTSDNVTPATKNDTDMIETLRHSGQIE